MKRAGEVAISVSIAIRVLYICSWGDSQLMKVLMGHWSLKGRVEVRVRMETLDIRWPASADSVSSYRVDRAESCGGHVR